ncbi:hypothetical protein BU14_2743s0001, partial [Porphyra umbilicalis]
MEAVVRGTVRDVDFMAVLSLIQSLCPDEGHLGRFREWERVYSPPPAAKAPSLCIRLRRALPIINPGAGGPRGGATAG